MREKIKDVNTIRKIPYGKKFICMFSGGKDCGLALSKAISQKCIPVALIHCLSEPNQKSLFHKQHESVAKAQADAIGVPLKCIEYKWWVEWEKITKLFEEYKKQGVEFVLYGDLSLDAIVENHIYLCHLVGLTPCVPLFHLDYNDIMDDIENHHIISVITEVDSELLDTSWLGRKFDRKAYQNFLKMGIDPFGENGEFHTTLIDGDFFDYNLEYSCVSMDAQHVQISII